MKLDKSFFAQNPVRVAELILGCTFIYNTEEGEVRGTIVETEAYGDEKDLACHASHGKTNRTKTLYEAPGTLYVYLNYGIFNLTNIVCGDEGVPGAVLLRSAQITKGQALVKDRLDTNKFVKANQYLATGPGKFSVAFGIDRSMNGKTVIGDNLYITNTTPRSFDTVAVKRIGIDYAGHCKDFLWRFYIKDNIYVSNRIKE